MLVQRRRVRGGMVSKVFWGADVGKGAAGFLSGIFRDDTTSPASRAPQQALRAHSHGHR